MMIFFIIVIHSNNKACTILTQSILHFPIDLENYQVNINDSLLVKKMLLLRLTLIEVLIWNEAYNFDLVFLLCIEKEVDN